MDDRERAHSGWRAHRVLEACGLDLISSKGVAFHRGPSKRTAPEPVPPACSFPRSLMKRLVLTLFSISLFFMPACQAGGSDPSGKNPGSAGLPEAAVAGASPGPVVARVNG